MNQRTDGEVLCFARRADAQVSEKCANFPRPCFTGATGIGERSGIARRRERARLRRNKLEQIPCNGSSPPELLAIRIALSEQTRVASGLGRRIVAEVARIE